HLEEPAVGRGRVLALHVEELGVAVAEVRAGRRLVRELAPAVVARERHPELVPDAGAERDADANDVHTAAGAYFAGAVRHPRAPRASREGHAIGRHRELDALRASVQAGGDDGAGKAGRVKTPLGGRAPEGIGLETLAEDTARVIERRAARGGRARA